MKRLLQCEDVDRDNVEEITASIRDKFAQYAALFRTKNSQYRLQTAKDVAAADLNFLGDIVRQPRKLKQGAKQFVRAWEQPEKAFEPIVPEKLQESIRKKGKEGLYDLAKNLSSEKQESKAQVALTASLLSFIANAPLPSSETGEALRTELVKGLGKNYERYQQQDPTTSDWSLPHEGEIAEKSFQATSKLYLEKPEQSVARKNKTECRQK